MALEYANLPQQLSRTGHRHNSEGRAGDMRTHRWMLAEGSLGHCLTHLR